VDLIKLRSYASGKWVDQNDDPQILPSAIDGAPIAALGRADLDFQSMRAFAKSHGGRALCELTFHQRAKMLKALGLYLNERKEALYELSYQTGTTLTDARVDIDGGIGTLLAFASKGRRELPDGHVYLDGDVEQLSRNGTFIVQHICTPLQGVGVHIISFNFPVLCMLEKLAPSLLAGVPAIIKPASATSYLTEACFKMMIDSELLPVGSVQLICGGIGDLLDHLDCQDVVSFTGSATTAHLLRSNENLLKQSVRFVGEQDSLNASILGPDVSVDAPEFDLFVKEVIREMTVKAGQKCTAIRRIMVPDSMAEPILDALSAKLAKVAVGDPRDEKNRMGALVSRSQCADVLEKADQIGSEAERVFGDPDSFSPNGAGTEKGAFLPPQLFHCKDGDSADLLHRVEAFGPVSTVMSYRDLDHACELTNRGGGSLVASLVTHDPQVAVRVAQRCAAWHGRIYINDRASMKEATGHGAPMPQMVHGGPGRAGGGEELGGVRGVLHYMQRTAIQGSPQMITAIGGKWVSGAQEIKGDIHPFKKTYGDLSIGETLNTPLRKISLDDIEHFANFTGDTFYAHMDEEAAKANPFFPGRVAHGYLLLSFAAGLFVQADPGPVLANTGLEGLKFMKPVSPGDSIRVRLTVKKKTQRTDDYGEVRWNVTLYNQDDEQVAEYELHTMNAY